MSDIAFDVVGFDVVVDEAPPVQDFILIEGGQGPQGDDGAPGAPGSPGAPGATTWAGITDKPSTFTPTSHTHLVSDTTGLQAALDVKQDASTAVTLTGTQTLTNKTLNGATLASPFMSGPRFQYIFDSVFNYGVMRFTGASNAVNYVNATSTVTGGAPTLGVYSATDTNVSLNLGSQGSGVVQANGVPVVTTTGTQTLTNKTVTSPKVNQILDDNGLPIISLGATASAVNNVQVFNSATAVAPSVRAIGSDTNISLNLVSKGTGLVMANGQIVLTQNMPVSLDYYFTANGMKFNSVADPRGYSLFIGTSATGTPANYFKFTNAISGAAPSLSAVGTDTNISLNFNAKGTGTVQANGNPVVVNVAVPATATSAGVAGQHAYDSSYVYVCTATDTWKRAALSTW